MLLCKKIRGIRHIIYVFEIGGAIKEEALFVEHIKLDKCGEIHSNCTNDVSGVAFQKFNFCVFS